MDSHEVVSYWMVEANKWMADTLHKNEKGIYRTAYYSELPSGVSNDHKEIIQTYLHTHSQYMLWVSMLDNKFIWFCTFLIFFNIVFISSILF